MLKGPWMLEFAPKENIDSMGTRMKVTCVFKNDPGVAAKLGSQTQFIHRWSYKFPYYREAVKYRTSSDCWRTVGSWPITTPPQCHGHWLLLNSLGTIFGRINPGKNGAARYDEWATWKRNMKGTCRFHQSKSLEIVALSCAVWTSSKKVVMLR